MAGQWAGDPRGSTSWSWEDAGQSRGGLHDLITRPTNRLAFHTRKRSEGARECKRDRGERGTAESDQLEGGRPPIRQAATLQAQIQAPAPPRPAPDLDRRSAEPRCRPGHGAEDGGACLSVHYRRLRPSRSGSATPGCRPAPGALHGPGGLIPRESQGCSPATWTSGDPRADGPASRSTWHSSKGEAIDRWRLELKRLVLVFNKEKETKGTYRYQEVAERDTAVGS